MNRVVISLPPDLHERIKVLALERKLSMAGLLRHYLDEEIDQEDLTGPWAQKVAEERALYVAAPPNWDERDRNTDMRRTIISLPTELHRRVKARAAESGITMAEVIRRAVEKRAPGERRLPRGLGMFASAHTDTAEMAGELRYEPRPWR